MQPGWVVTTHPNETIKQERDKAAEGPLGLVGTCMLVFFHRSMHMK